LWVELALLKQEQCMETNIKYLYPILLQKFFVG